MRMEKIVNGRRCEEEKMWRRDGDVRGKEMREKRRWRCER